MWSLQAELSGEPAAGQSRQPCSARLVASGSSAALPVRRSLAPAAAGSDSTGANGSISGWQTVPAAGSTPLMS
jgi:hypothetical protein